MTRFSSFRHYRVGREQMGGFLMAATRKGLFDVDFDGTAQPRCIGFLGDPVSAVLQNAHDGALYAALNLGHFGVKLHRSDDFGQTWTELPAPAFPVGIAADKDGEKAPSVSLIWSLAPSGPEQPKR